MTDEDAVEILRRRLRGAALTASGDGSPPEKMTLTEGAIYNMPPVEVDDYNQHLDETPPEQWLMAQKISVDYFLALRHAILALGGEWIPDDPDEAFRSLWSDVA